jgi:uncharacterized protein (DUF2252 family)
MNDQESSTLLDEIIKANAGRKRSLLRIKFEEMAAGVFSFYRATNHLFARGWSSIRPIDPGPPIVICGDLHLENFGAYLTESGDCRFAINDFDEAWVAPAAIDLVRFSASILLAADEWRLTTTAAVAMGVEFLDRYRAEAISASADGKAVRVDLTTKGGAIFELLAPTAISSREALLAVMTEIPKGAADPIIKRDPKRRSIRPKTLEKIREGFESLENVAGIARPIEVIDATTRIAGLGSLGLRRYLVLVRGIAAGERLRLLDVKEATPSALRDYIDALQPDWGEDEASRIIRAERLVLDDPERGLAAIEVGQRSCRVREMIPDANRSKLSRLRRDPVKLREAVQAAGGIAARAHVRGAMAVGPERENSLANWANGPAFDSILVAAARAADRCRAEFEEFRRLIGRKAVRKQLQLAPVITADGRD